MVRIRLVLLLTILATGLLAGCSTRTPGTATPAPNAQETETSSPDESPSESPDDGVPQVDDPLDASKFEDDPCLALDATQSGDLDLGASGTPVRAPSARLACGRT